MDQPADAVCATIEWRRRDRHPESIGMRVFRLEDEQEVHNVCPLQITRVWGKVAFAAQKAGRYAIYFLPCEDQGRYFYIPKLVYRPAEYPDADSAWLERAKKDTRLEAVVEEIQARTAVDRFDMMELVADEDELAGMVARHGERPFMLFPEDREHPIRMLDDLPISWVLRGPANRFMGCAQPNEYYAFQIGVWARQALPNLKVEWTGLQGVNSAEIRADVITCFNVSGTDWLGSEFIKDISIAAAAVQPLWFGVDVPRTATLGLYHGTIRIAATGLPAQEIKVELKVAGEVLVDRGDRELWRHARLRWLNSTIGLDDEPASGYPPVVVDGNEVTVLGRKVWFGPNGLPERAASFFAPSVDSLQDTPVDILARPIDVVAETASGPVHWTGSGVEIKQAGSGAVIARASSSSASATAAAKGLTMDVHTRLEFDGHMDYRVLLTAEADCELTDLALELPLRREVAEYMMGMGRKSGYRPAEWHYAWNADRANHYVWLGTVNAGLHLKLKHDTDVWELRNLRSSGFPTGWYNEGQGGCDVVERGEGEVLIRAFCGPRKLLSGETVSLRFSLIITPLKLLDLKGHWQQRYHHIDCWDGRKPDLAEAKRSGATVVNLHQGGNLNPYINYPFYCNDAIRAETDAAHAAGLKYKLYYTVRELSHMAAELWAFRSLNGEIYKESGKAAIADQFTMSQDQDVVAGGTGGPWLREHLVDRYVSAWQQKLPDGEIDQSIATTGLSRLHNYYLEGLAWLIRELGMDGIYLDGVGYDRQIMKRVRKVMDRARPGCLIDFHSGNEFHPAYGLSNWASEYIELLPYVDSLWIGEGFDYNESPDYYMTEICGIPFGLANDMLQGGGNPWRGMVYGMTCRYGWQQGGDPRQIWKLWEEFGMGESRMFGYWTPDCPVRTDHPQVLATAYVKRNGKVMIALASWAPEPVSCRLTIACDKLGVAADDVVLLAPDLSDFQPATGFLPDAAIPVATGRGWLLTLEVPSTGALAVSASFQPVHAQLLQSGNWRVQAMVNLMNLGRVGVRGEMNLRTGPEATCAPTTLHFDLAPKATGAYPVEMETTGPATLYAKFATPSIFATEWEWRWQPEFLSLPAATGPLPPSAVSTWFHGRTGWIILGKGGVIGARLRLGKAAETLLVELEVTDPQRVRDDNAFWNGSAVELFLAKTADGLVRQLVFLPPVDAKPADWRVYRAGQEQAAPGVIAWEMADTADGYHWVACIPLAAFGMKHDTVLDECRFECVVTGSPLPPATGRRRVALAEAPNASLSAVAFVPLRIR